MGLSEHEMKMLQQMEQQLREENPKLAREFSKTVPSVQMKNVVLGVLGAVIGLAGVLGAVIVKVPLLAIPAFLLMCASIWWALQDAKMKTVQAQSRTNTKAAPNSFQSFMDDLEKKWEDRQRGPEV